MVKNGVKSNAASKKNGKRILITQPKPETDKSPYYELSRKYSIELSFHPFIRLEGIPAKEFRKQKIDISFILRPLSLPAAMPLIIFFAPARK